MTKDIEKKYSNYVNELFPVILGDSIKTIIKTRHFYETFFDIAVEEVSEIYESDEIRQVIYDELENILKDYVNTFSKKD